MKARFIGLLKILAQVCLCAVLIFVVARAQISHGQKPEADGTDQSIKLADAIMLARRADVLFLDVRSRGFFSRGHIKGAVNLPLTEMNEVTIAVVVRDHANIVVYCDGQTCLAGPQAVNLLRKHPRLNVMLYRGGWNEWLSLDFPIERGQL